MTTNVPTPAPADVKKDSKGLLITGILLAILGVVAVALPVASTIFAETWVALILASAGAAKIYYAFKSRQEGGFIWKLLLGILYIATGVMLFIYPRTGILSLTLLLGSFLLTEGVFNIILAFRLRPQRNWFWVLVDGIVTIGLGGMIWFQWPFDAPWVIGTLVGVSILFTGVSRIMLSLNSGDTFSQSNQPTSA